MNDSLELLPLDSLEKALGQIDPGPPPADMAARCIAALPEAADNLTPIERFAGALSRVFQSATPRRLVLAAGAVALLALWTTWPMLHKDGKPLAPASAFAETLSVMGHVTAWSATSRQIGFEPGDGKTKFHYFFNRGWSESTEWFDADRGIYDDQSTRDGSVVQRTLMLPNGDWYFRHADPSSKWDKTRINHMGTPYWKTMRNAGLNNLRNPAYWANNFDRPATAPPTTRSGEWKGHKMLVFTFDVAPPDQYKAADYPTKRTEIYVDPETKMIAARQEFSRWPNHPDRGEHVTWVQEFDYSKPAAPTLFDAQQFCMGTKEIQQQQNNGSAIVLDPQ